MKFANGMAGMNVPNEPFARVEYVRLEAKVTMFGRPLTAVLDTDEALATYNRIETLHKALDANVPTIPFRAAELLPETLKEIRHIIEQARKLAGIHKSRPDERNHRSDVDKPVKDGDLEYVHDGPHPWI